MGSFVPGEFLAPFHAQCIRQQEEANGTNIPVLPQHIAYPATRQPICSLRIHPDPTIHHHHPWAFLTLGTLHMCEVASHLTSLLSPKATKQTPLMGQACRLGGINILSLLIASIQAIIPHLIVMSIPYALLLLYPGMTLALLRHRYNKSRRTVSSLIPSHPTNLNIRFELAVPQMHQQLYNCGRTITTAHLIPSRQDVEGKGTLGTLFPITLQLLEFAENWRTDDVLSKLAASIRAQEWVELELMEPPLQGANYIVQESILPLRTSRSRFELFFDCEDKCRCRWFEGGKPC